MVTLPALIPSTWIHCCSRKDCLKKYFTKYQLLWDFTTRSWQFSIFLYSFLLISLGTMELNLKSGILDNIHFLLTSPLWNGVLHWHPLWWGLKASWQCHAVCYMQRTSHYVFRHLLLPVRFAWLLKCFQEARCFCCVILKDLCRTLAWPYFWIWNKKK